MPHVFIESREEFYARHGEHLEINGMVYFEDGATYYPSDTGIEMRREPPASEFERLKAARFFTEHKARRAVAEFDRAQARFAEQAALAQRYGMLPGPPANADQILEGLAAEARRWRAKYDEVSASLAARPEMREQNAAQWAIEDMQRRNGEMLARISRVRL